MSAWFETLRLLADPTRLRILAILRRERLSVAEVQEVLNMGQSRISTHLAQLRKGALLEDQREGKNIFYAWAHDLPEATVKLVEETLRQCELGTQLEQDQEALRGILIRRRERSERYFNAIAGRAGKKYCPGRSWESLANLFLEFLGPIEVADLGAGEGLVSELLARRAKRVIAVDISKKMVDVGRERAQRLGLNNLDFRVGDIEAPPISPGSVDLALFSQALHHAANPGRALEAAFQILRPGGRLLILDLKQHQFDAARELYSDLWLGFREEELERWLRATGFIEVRLGAIEREAQAPHFQSLLATAVKPVSVGAVSGATPTASGSAVGNAGDVAQVDTARGEEKVAKKKRSVSRKAE